MDPITLDICWNRLIGVVNEQAAALMRTSFTSIVREAGDLSAGVFDRRGWMVAQAVTGTPGHINSMALAMKHILDVYPVDAWAPGRVRSLTWNRTPNGWSDGCASCRRWHAYGSSRRERRPRTSTSPTFRSRRRPER